MAFRDEHGAGHGTFGYDGNPQGLLHIVDLPSFKPLYRHPPCDRCGVASWWSTPEPKDCPSCAAHRRPANDEAALDDASDLPVIVAVVTEEPGVRP